jgi:hypothetical protein
MKKFLLSIATIAMATSAYAGSLNLDARVDYNATTFNSEATAADFTKFYFKTGRLDYAGKLNDDVNFRVRWSFTKDPAPALKDSLPAGIELAYITQKFSDDFSMTFGKMATEIGGFEGLTSGADLYLLSEAYNKRDANNALIGGATMFGTADMLYLTGAKATYAFAGQTISLATYDAEQNVTGGTPTALAQNYGVSGLVYRGAFMEKALQIIASYHTSSPNSDDKYNWYAAGVKWDSSPITASIDYVVTQHDATTDDKITSIIGKLAYTGMEQWVPRLEVTSSTSDIGGVENTYMGYGVVAEYVPKKEETFRYHVAINQVKESPDTGDDLDRTEIIVGTRLLADFLK